MLRYLADHPVDVLMAWEPSRMTRRLAVFTALRDLCHERGIEFADASGRLVPARDLSMVIKQVFADDEAEIIHKRVMRGIRSNAREGRPHGKVLYGYRREYALTNGQSVFLRQVADEKTAPIVREVFQRFAAGESRRTIMTDLNRRSVASPRASSWNDITQLTRMLTNPAYISRRVDQGKVIGDAAWPALIENALWARVQTRLANIAPNSRPGKRSHLLSGIARCGRPVGVVTDEICGERLVVGKAHASRGSHLTLLCPKLHLGRKEDVVDALVTLTLLERLRATDAHELLTSVTGTADRELGEALDTLAELQGQLADVRAAYLDRGITIDSFSRFEASLLPQIASAERRAQRWSGMPDQVLTLVGVDVEAKWDALTVQQRRGVVAAMVDVVVLPVGRGVRVFRPASVAIRWRV